MDTTVILQEMKNKLNKNVWKDDVSDLLTHKHSCSTFWLLFILILLVFFCCLVVTGATDGLGKAYAEEVIAI